MTLSASARQGVGRCPRRRTAPPACFSALTQRHGLGTTQAKKEQELKATQQKYGVDGNEPPQKAKS
jgi:hypothetical protein